MNWWLKVWPELQQLLLKAGVKFHPIPINIPSFSQEKVAVGSQHEVLDQANQEVAVEGLFELIFDAGLRWFTDMHFSPKQMEKLYKVGTGLMNLWLRVWPELQQSLLKAGVKFRPIPINIPSFSQEKVAVQHEVLDQANQEVAVEGLFESIFDAGLRWFTDMHFSPIQMEKLYKVGTELVKEWLKEWLKVWMEMEQRLKVGVNFPLIPINIPSFSQMEVALGPEHEVLDQANDEVAVEVLR